MERLENALRKHAAAAIDDRDPNTNLLPLVISAKDWAIHSLDTYSGDLLRKALAVSAALREFADEFNACESAAEARFQAMRDGE